MTVQCLIYSGCKNYQLENQLRPFRQLYGVKKQKTFKREVKKNEYKYNFSCYDMEFKRFATWFSDRTGLGVVFGSESDSKEVSGEWKNATANEIIKSVARRLGVDIVRVNDTYYLGTLKPEDRGILVRHVSGYAGEEVQKAVETQLSEFGKVIVYNEGVVIVSDRESVISKVSQMLDYLESINNTSWIIQIYFIVIQKNKLRDLGVELKPSGTISYDIKNEKVGVNYDAIIEAVINSSFNNNFSSLLASPMFLLNDGAKGKWSDSRQVPYPKKCMTEFGALETTEYEYKEVGLIANAEIRKSKTGVELKLSIQNSQVTGYNEFAPEIRITELNSEFTLESNKIYLVGEMNSDSVQDGITNYLSFTDNKGGSIMQVWCKVYQIEGGAKEEYNSFKENIKNVNYAKSVL